MWGEGVGCEDGEGWDVGPAEEGGEGVVSGSRGCAEVRGNRVEVETGPLGVRGRGPCSTGFETCLAGFSTGYCTSGVSLSPCLPFFIFFSRGGTARGKTLPGKSCGRPGGGEVM